MSVCSSPGEKLWTLRVSTHFCCSAGFAHWWAKPTSPQQKNLSFKMKHTTMHYESEKRSGLRWKHSSRLSILHYHPNWYFENASSTKCRLLLLDLCMCDPTGCLSELEANRTSVRLCADDLPLQNLSIYFSCCVSYFVIVTWKNSHYLLSHCPVGQQHPRSKLQVAYLTRALPIFFYQCVFVYWMAAGLRNDLRISLLGQCLFHMQKICNLRRRWTNESKPQIQLSRSWP